MDDSLRQRILDQVLSTLDLQRPKLPGEFNKDDLISRAAESGTTLTIKRARLALNDLVASGQLTWRWAKVSDTGREKVYAWGESPPYPLSSTDLQDDV